MFAMSHDVFLIESYFRNGGKLEHGEWSYSLQPGIEEFWAEFQFFQHMTVGGNEFKSQWPNFVKHT